MLLVQIGSAELRFRTSLTFDKITELDIERYKEWRKTYWTQGSGAEKK